MIRRLAAVTAAVGVLFGLGVGPAAATWSVVGTDPDTGEVGVAVASCVGFEVTVVPVLVAGIGAAASQANISRPSGVRIVDALESGSTASAVIDAVVAADDSPEIRQFGVVVLDDGAAGWTGSDTLDVAVDRVGDANTVAVQGNTLVSADVADAAVTTFSATEGALPDRLLAALVAGADAGGDSRCGPQTATAAALLVARPGDGTYAFTDSVLLGVDPASEAVPSIFVSVLLNRGDERAPDRLLQVWNAADKSTGSVVIRQIDDGADASRTRSLVMLAVIAGLLIMAGIAVVAIILRSRRKRRSGPE